MKNNNMTRNLGEGNITKLLASLAIPAVVAQVVNLLYNIVDRVYIGHIPGIGANALTGVGLFTPILMLINAFAMLAGSGGAPRAAIFMGKKDNDTAERIIGNCFTFIMICAVVLTAVFYVSAPQLLRWFGASDATLPYALSYARIYILGSVFVLIVMAMNMGADDFINKPFDLNVLTAKIQAILRRTYSFSKQFHILTYKDLVLNILEATISYQIQIIELTKNELKIMQMLFEKSETFVSRDDLMIALWQSDQFVDDNTLSVNMNRLRKKLDDFGFDSLIQTKKGLGYKLYYE